MSTDGFRVCNLGDKVGKTVDSLPVDRPGLDGVAYVEQGGLWRDHVSAGGVAATDSALQERE